MWECQGNPLARVTLALGLPYLLVNRALKFGCCLNVTVTVNKGEIYKGSKKRDGGSNGNLNGESAKETMLSEMRLSG